jgi:hypothetical protein
MFWRIWLTHVDRRWRKGGHDFALSVSVHVPSKSLRFAELEGTKPTLVDLITLFFPILSAAFLFPVACQKKKKAAN